MSQDKRVLAVLRRRGDRGTHRLEWAGPDVVDAGAPILHLGGRIDSLKNAGHVIESHHRRPDRIVTYILVAAADADPPQPESPPLHRGRAGADVDLQLKSPPDGEMCSCARALPRPGADGELRCARCERRTNGWQW